MTVCINHIFASHMISCSLTCSCFSALLSFSLRQTRSSQRNIFPSGHHTGSLPLISARSVSQMSRASERLLSSNPISPCDMLTSLHLYLYLFLSDDKPGHTHTQRTKAYIISDLCVLDQKHTLHKYTHANTLSKHVTVTVKILNTQEGVKVSFKCLSLNQLLLVSQMIV